MDEFPTTWETVSTNSSLTTSRLRVPGGFLVIIRDSTNSSTNVMFVSEPSHNWTLEL